MMQIFHHALILNDQICVGFKMSHWLLALHYRSQEFHLHLGFRIELRISQLLCCGFEV